MHCLPRSHAIVPRCSCAGYRVERYVSKRQVAAPRCMQKKQVGGVLLLDMGRNAYQTVLLVWLCWCYSCIFSYYFSAASRLWINLGKVFDCRGDCRRWIWLAKEVVASRARKGRKVPDPVAYIRGDSRSLKEMEKENEGWCRHRAIALWFDLSLK